MGTLVGELTPRQVEILELVRRDRSDKEMAEELCVSTLTVAWHLRKLRRLARVTSRLQLGLLAERCAARAGDAYFMGTC